MVNTPTDAGPIIYTTGAFLRPFRTTYPNGQEIWGWRVTGFEDDSFMDGEIFNPPDLASSRDVLLVNTTPDA